MLTHPVLITGTPAIAADPQAGALAGASGRRAAEADGGGAATPATAAAGTPAAAGPHVARRPATSLDEAIGVVNEAAASVKRRVAALHALERPDIGALVQRVLELYSFASLAVREDLWVVLREEFDEHLGAPSQGVMPAARVPPLAPSRPSSPACPAGMRWACPACCMP